MDNHEAAIEQAIMRLAEAEAGFDGRGWMAMSKSERLRYVARIKTGLALVDADVFGALLDAAFADGAAKMRTEMMTRLDVAHNEHSYKAYQEPGDEAQGWSSCLYHLEDALSEVPTPKRNQ